MTVSLRMQPSIKALLDKAAARKGQSKSEWLERAIMAAVREGKVSK